ncbi:hypothetical protein H6P81_008267 [Aristolochia fimbriata]|uniref:Uncharacterized protein n=1 Tax=Aristolochia fimbriata TaxID=158543 RepID=A0AAV7F2S6_ARIFI|nr:hypothetical protein H6P81_008267 [Aristolochia fimbriata]
MPEREREREKQSREHDGETCHVWRKGGYLHSARCALADMLTHSPVALMREAHGTHDAGSPHVGRWVLFLLLSFPFSHSKILVAKKKMRIRESELREGDPGWQGRQLTLLQDSQGRGLKRKG